MNLNKWLNEKSGKTHKSISDEIVQERISLNRDSMKMRYKPNTMTINPEKQIVKLNKPSRSNPRISTPTNGCTGDKGHDVIKRRRLYIRVHRLLYQRYIKSRGHYIKSNNILFTPYATLYKLNVGIIGVNGEVWVKLSNQYSRRRMPNI